MARRGLYCNYDIEFFFLLRLPGYWHATHGLKTATRLTDLFVTPHSLLFIENFGDNIEPFLINLKFQSRTLRPMLEIIKKMMVLKYPVFQAGRK